MSQKIGPGLDLARKVKGTRQIEISPQAIELLAEFTEFGIAKAEIEWEILIRQNNNLL